MARKKKGWKDDELTPKTQEEIDNEVAEIKSVMGITDAEAEQFATKEPKTVFDLLELDREADEAELKKQIEAAPETEAETKLPEKYKAVFDRLTPGMAIFENIDNDKEWVQKNMVNAKQVIEGIYQFNGYRNGSKPKNWRLIKKK